MVTPIAKYVFDTSAFIDSWRRVYPYDLFPQVWSFIGEAIQKGLIISNVVVKREIDVQEDDLKQFCVPFKAMFKNPDEKEQECVKKLIDHPDFDQWGKSRMHEADPFVVCQAKAKGLTVVTYENSRATKNHIPAACRIMHVPCINFVEYLRAEHFTSGINPSPSPPRK